ncbi:MAG: hypothetical protein NVSMB1_14990 [Polyangiales bacterium]
MNLSITISGPNGDEKRVMNYGGAPLTIGRDPSCDIPLRSREISRLHVVAILRDATMLVTDSSTNGTLVGDQYLRGTSSEVPQRTAITLGEYTLRLWLLEQAARRSPSTSASSARTNANGPAATPSNYKAPAVVKASPKETLLGAPLDSPTPSDANASANAPQDLTAANDHLELRREIHRLLLEHLDLSKVAASHDADPSLRPKVLQAIRRIVQMIDARIPAAVDRTALVGELVDEAIGLGPLEQFLADPTVSEIMVVDPHTIYVERGGRLVLAPVRFTDDERVRAVIERIVTPLGRRIDESSPLVDARLQDGSRVNAIIRPLALRGSCITIRKFARTPLMIDDLIRFGAMNEEIAQFLTRSVIAKKNIAISGGTGSGKTTLLNVLSSAIPAHERVVTIEDAAELQLKQPHVVSLETRPPNMEGKGEYSIRDLVKNALRMRPDRIVVGECRGARRSICCKR